MIIYGHHGGVNQRGHFDYIEDHFMSTMARWSGRFCQGGNWTEMCLDHMYMTKDNLIKGHGSDAVGGFSIDGTVQPSGKVHFKKAYHGAHTVVYDGQMDN